MKEESKEKIKTTLAKSKKVQVETKKGGSYSYKYTELADINQYIENIGETYYQFIERIDNDDYIMTVRVKNEIESTPRRGCRVVQASLDTVSNQAQEQGSALTYARRYSLLMAYGLATEDDDAGKLTKPKIENKEDAESFVINFGKKHKGKTLKEIYEEDIQYIDWLEENTKDENIKNCIKIINSKNEKTVANASEEDIPKAINLKKEFDKYLIETETDLEKVLQHYAVLDSTHLTFEQMEDAIKNMAKKIKPKEEKGVF